MTASVSHVGKIFILRFDNHFVGAYDSMEEVDNVIDAYRGIVK